MGKLTKDDIRKQSEQAYGQWCELWRSNSKENSKWCGKGFDDFKFQGLGRACVLVANGYSLEKEIETLRKLQDHVDIAVCDKTLGLCIDHGITPTFCILADARVDYEKYMHKWRDKLSNTYLFQNVCGNPKWAENGNWKDRYFFVNEDILQSEKEFSEISGCKNFIPAGTNVSNAMLVALTQSNNNGRNNYFGYDKYILLGFDYCWRDNYYAFNKDGDGKINYMRHVYAIDDENELCYTSNNLLFSVKWLSDYIATFKLPVVQCSKGTLLQLPEAQMQDLESQMVYNYRPEDSKKVINLLEKVNEYKKQIEMWNKDLNQIAEAHHYACQASL